MVEHSPKILASKESATATIVSLSRGCDSRYHSTLYSTSKQAAGGQSLVHRSIASLYLDLTYSTPCLRLLIKYRWTIPSAREYRQPLQATRNTRH